VCQFAFLSIGDALSFFFRVVCLLRRKDVSDYNLDSLKTNLCRQIAFRVLLHLVFREVVQYYSLSLSAVIALSLKIFQDLEILGYWSYL